MSQFQGYTLEITLNDASKTVLTGTISKVVDKNLTVTNITYADGTKKDEEEVFIRGSDIADLKVIELPDKTKSKKEKKKKEKKKDRESTPAPIEQKQKSKKNGSNKQNTMSPQDPNLPYNYRDNDIDWDSDSVEKIKQADEFDFESNLQKFDKSSVFKELSNNDKINPENRLVSHNKLPDAKYGIDEMVINNKEDQWEKVDVEASSGSSSAADELSQIKDEAALLSFIKKNSNGSSTGASTPLPSLTPLPTLPSGSSPVVLAKSSPAINSPSSRVASPLSTSSGAVTFKSSDDNEPVHLCSPLQLMEIESIANEKFGVTSQIINENAGRETASIIIDILVGKTQRISSQNHNSPPLVLILAGNNKAGARALCAGRHIFNHGIRVIAFLLHDADSEDEPLSEVSSQLTIFNSIGGKTVTSVVQLQNLLSKIDYPLEFILDGLQGYDTNIADLIDSELKNAIDILKWCNNLSLLTMSLDIPSGLDPSTGQLCDDDIPAIKSKWVISQGLPVSSLANAYKLGVTTKGEWKHYLIDIGIPLKVFASKSNLRKFNRQIFSKSWNLVLEVV